MANISVPYLCGGVFFSLLSQIKRTFSSKEKYDAISEPKLMAKLIEVVTETEPDQTSDGFSKSVSDYKTCQNKGGKNVPFNQSFQKDNFDEQVRNHYSNVLNRMIDFTNNCLLCETVGNRIQLVKSLLALIKDDQSIKKETKFFIKSDGTPLTKTQLEEEAYFELEPFLIGVLHYIIVTPTINTDGRDTYKMLFPSKASYKQGEFDSTTLSSIKRSITVDRTLKKTSHFFDETCGNITQIPPKKNIYIKPLYKSSLLCSEADKQLLSDTDLVIDLNKTPKLPNNNENPTAIYKLTTNFHFKSEYSITHTRQIVVTFELYGLIFTGCTSINNWESQSAMNTIVNIGKNNCTAWFKFISFDKNKPAVQFLMIGDDVNE